MGTPTQYNRIGLRNNRASAVRGVTVETPMGWSVPDTAERLASFARSMGWDVQAEWFQVEETGLMRFKLELGRMLYPGENRAAKGDRWIYRLIWEEMPGDERLNHHYTRMKLVINRALTPTTGEWQNGPSLKMVTDLVGRHPKPVRRRMSVQPVTIKADPSKVG